MDKGNEYKVYLMIIAKIFTNEIPTNWNINNPKNKFIKPVDSDNNNNAILILLRIPPI